MNVNMALLYVNKIPLQIEDEMKPTICSGRWGRPVNPDAGTALALQRISGAKLYVSALPFYTVARWKRPSLLKHRCTSCADVRRRSAVVTGTFRETV